MKHSFCYLLFVWVCACKVPAQPADPIRLNQTGYYPHAPKMAVVVEGGADRFWITRPGGKDTLYRGALSAPRTASFSGKITRIADFSPWQEPGTYVLGVTGVGVSYPFEIRASVHRDIAAAALKGFYYQRASTPLLPADAGIWAREAGHPDDQVQVHASAASPARPAGTLIASPRGWYDAGDYNKYIVNSGITMGTLLSLYEDFPAYVKTFQTEIPERNNALPDLLDEVCWNLRWMLTMQDPADGGVYHKLTNPAFGPLAQAPALATGSRFVVQKSTAATLDFAAVMAQAARVFGAYPEQLPGLADSCRTAAVAAWQWALLHPAVIYDQEALNKAYNPDIETGTYGDHTLTDEWIWAAAELYVTTGDTKYYHHQPMVPDDEMPIPSWNQVRLLGYYTLLRHQAQLGPVASQDLASLKSGLIRQAQRMTAGLNQHAYATVMGASAKDYVWGSSAVAANQGIFLIQAYLHTGERVWLDAALGNLDYLLGRNATGYSFLTGYGDKTPLHPHHRPSEGDEVSLPVPGLLSGGPNPGRQDKCTTYTSTFPDECFTDDACSYASNEIAINWNAPMVYLAAAIEALQERWTGN
ncbi:MAG: glycoside hydrolase family 9 protein [Bacteroidia bacterium]|nr:glycoside hydrolase family 9 protein [Bacteroidia bacterium]